jgi:hypothetical protein
MKNSEGVGEAYGGAIQTFGALDMGGASSQISFFQPDGDVMSGLFKLQVGQGRHWNVYAHSHLMFGIDMADLANHFFCIALALLFFLSCTVCLQVFMIQGILNKKLD